MGLDPRTARLLDAVLVVAADVDLEKVLRRVVEAACSMVDARYGALGVIGEDGGLAAFVHAGVDDATVRAIGDLPRGQGILGLLIEHPEPLRLDDLRDHPSSFGFPPQHPPMGSFLGAPIRVRDEVFGNLYLTEKRDGASFTAEDEAMVVGLAAVAGTAVANARLVDDRRRLGLIEDRERIGRDLHDTVIQRLFATGLTLQALTRRVEDRPEVVERLSRAVDDIDDTVKEIRSTIFKLQMPQDVGVSVRAQALEVVDEVAQLLPAAPRVRFHGPLDTAVGEPVASHLLRVLREALTNVAKHARATTVELDLAVQDGELCLDVRDDGVGLPDDAGDRGMGLGNLARRAEAVGGRFTVVSRPTGGTHLTWCAPLSG